mgnify:FL=1
MTAREFKVPLEFKELEASQVDAFCVESAPSLDITDTAGLKSTLDTVATPLLKRQGTELLSENETFDTLYAFV